MKYKGVIVKLTRRKYQGDSRSKVENDYGYRLPWGTQGIGFLSLRAAVNHARQAVDSKLRGEGRK